jgi:hypothetical protein
VELWGGSNNDIQDRHRDMVCVCICKTPTLLCYDVGLVPVVMMAEDPLFFFLTDRVGVVGVQMAKVPLFLLLLLLLVTITANTIRLDIFIIICL